MAKALCITDEESLEGLRLLGFDILKVKEESELDYGKIKPYSLLIVQDKFYDLLKQFFPSKIIFPLSGLKERNYFLKKSLKDSIFKATSQRIEL